MDFSFSEEQTLLRNSVQSLLADKYDFDTRRKIVKSAEGWSPAMWKQFAELGLLAAPFSEELGGLGGGAIETMILAEEFGRHLVVELSSRRSSSPVLPPRRRLEGASRGDMLGIVDGSTVWPSLCRAAGPPQPRRSRYPRRRRTTPAYVINGYKAVVIAAPWAQKLIVTARTSGGQRDRDGVSVFIVDKNAAGVSTRDYPTVDGRRASEITFENVKVGPDALIGTEGKGLALVEKVTDQAIAAPSAGAVGCMGELNKATVEYCKTRKQFGVPIGKFQVLQHRMVDMFMAYEQSVSMTYMVNLKLTEDEAERVKAAAGAKVQTGKAGRFVGQQAVQLHGGMGMTDELNVGHYFKRLTMIDTQFGNVDYQLKRYSEAA